MKITSHEVERKSSRSKYYVVVEHLRDEDGNLLGIPNPVSVPLSQDDAVAFRIRCENDQSKTAKFWYKCPLCETGFPYAPNSPSDFVFGHCGHQCQQCSTFMDWDEPTETGQPRPCAHPHLRKANSVRPKKVGRIAE